MLALTNSPSDNFFAETLLKDLGARLRRRRHDRQRRGGRARRDRGTSSGSIRVLDDGSGLSRADRTTAVRRRERCWSTMQPDPTFTNSLAIAGDPRDDAARDASPSRAVGNCRGKTGTLSDVANLVGYCSAANGDHLVFAFLMNSQANADYGHEQEDLMGETLAAYDPGPQRYVPTRTTPTRTTPTTAGPTTTVTTPTVVSGGTSPP